MNRVSRVKKPSASPVIRPSGWQIRMRSSRLVVIDDGPTWTGNVIARSIASWPRRSAMHSWVSASRGDLCQHPAGLLAADLADVFLVLQDDAERLVDEFGLQLTSAEGEQRGCPIERLCDARDLGQVGVPEPMDETDDLTRELLGRLRDSRED